MNLFNRKEKQTSKESVSIEIMVEPNKNNFLKQNNEIKKEKSNLNDEDLNDEDLNDEDLNDEINNENIENKVKLISNKNEDIKINSKQNEKQLKNEESNLFSQSIFIKLFSKFFKYFIFFLIIYLIGYFQLSFAWILICLTIYFIQLGYKTRRKEVMHAEQDLVLDEKKVIERLLVDLPNWVYFPDTERVEWMNKMIKQLWPFLDLFVKKMVREKVLPNLISYLPEYMKGLHFEEIDLGTIPLKIGSIKCHTERSLRNEILLDLQIIYAGNSRFILRCFKFAAGIKDLQLFGQLRVRLFPLVEHIPLVGAISCTFLNCPKLDFNLISLADLFDLPGLSDLIRKAIMQQISSYIVYPNIYVIPLTDIPIKQLKLNEPAGVLRLEIIGASDLKKSDYGMLGMGKSDPYCKCFISSYIITTQVIPNTVNPQWNFVCEVAIGDSNDEEINIEVYDQDQGTSDDFLGRLSLKIFDYDCSGEKIYSLPLEDTDTGTLNIRLTWFKLITDLSKLNDQLNNVEKIKTLYTNKMSMIKNIQQKSIDTNQQTEIQFGSVFCCIVFLDSIQNLPNLGQNQLEPSIFVDISFGKSKRKSITCESNCNPVYEQSFIFLSGSLEEEPSVKFELIELKSKKIIGETAINLLGMIRENLMSFNEPIHVKIGQTAECILHVMIELRLLKQENIQKNPSKNNLNESNLNEKDSDKNDSIIDGSSPTQIPSLDNMVYSTVLPFVKTMEYKVEEKSKNETNTDKNLTRINETILNSFINLNSLQTEPIQHSDRNSKLDLNLNKKPQISITINNLNNINYEPITFTIHHIINLPKLKSRKDYYFIKINAFSLERKTKYKTKKLFKNNCPSFNQTILLRNSKNNLITYLELHLINGKQGIFKISSFDKRKRIARVVINLYELKENNLTLDYDLKCNEENL